MPSPVHSAAPTPIASAAPLPVRDPMSPLIWGPTTGMRCSVESITCFWNEGFPSSAKPRIAANASRSAKTEKNPQNAIWGFFSVFALLLAFAAILGFALDGNPSFQKQVIDSTLQRMPVVGPQISGDIGSLTGSGAALAIGVGAALWTGLGITVAMTEALDHLWTVPRARRSGFVRSRLRGLLVLASVGAVNVAATAA